MNEWITFMTIGIIFGIAVYFISRDFPYSPYKMKSRIDLLEERVKALEIS